MLSDARKRVHAAAVFVKDVEGLFITAMQWWIPHHHVRPLIRISKLCTKKHTYYAYMILLLYNTPPIFVRTVATFYLSRSLNTALKSIARQPRPYNEYPATIAYFDKRKQSRSFPSQSIQTLWIVRCAFQRSAIQGEVLIQIYFVLIMLAVSLTRMYRGLHYMHDIVGSILIANTLCMLI